VKVEAKVWLANQRTFIKWQHVSVLLASLSVGLYNAAGQDNDVARALALVYTIVAVLTAAWGYGIYMWRVDLIQRRSGKDFDAITGPIVVCVGLIVALVLNFVFKVSFSSLSVSAVWRSGMWDGMEWIWLTCVIPTVSSYAQREGCGKDDRLRRGNGNGGAQSDRCCCGGVAALGRLVKEIKRA